MSRNTSNFTLRTILEKEKLNGTNFIDWYRNLRIVLKQEKKEYVLENSYPVAPPEDAVLAELRDYEKHCSDAVDVSCLMLATMSSDLQKQYESADPFDMIKGLCGMFENQARVERYNTSKALFACKLAQGNPVSPHVIKMIGYIESLEKLGFPLSQELATDVILQSLPQSYEPFILNFNMNSMEKTKAELHGMLKTAEESIKKNSSHVMVVRNSGKKRKDWGKSKGKGKTKDEISGNKAKKA